MNILDIKIAINGMKNADKALYKSYMGSFSNLAK